MSSVKDNSGNYIFYDHAGNPVAYISEATLGLEGQHADLTHLQNFFAGQTLDRSVQPQARERLMIQNAAETVAAQQMSRPEYPANSFVPNTGAAAAPSTPTTSIITQATLNIDVEEARAGIELAKENESNAVLSAFEEHIKQRNKRWAREKESKK